jgi:hypothetical protein
MGNSSSASIFGPTAPPVPLPPAPSPPMPVVSLPLQRTPVADGASGLHYSGKIYTNQAERLSSDLCNGATASPAQIDEIYPKGVSSPGLPMDQTTHRISHHAIQGHVETLIGQGLIPGQIGDFSKQMTADKAFYAGVQAEYCFYEARYVAALAQFLKLVAAQPPADSTTVQAALNKTVALNKRLNSLLEVINYVGNERARQVNARGPEIEKANKDIQDKLTVLGNQKQFLEGSDAVTRTQGEMMRYSSEKNRSMAIQIMFFVALNVVALGTVLTVYKSLPGGGGTA